MASVPKNSAKNRHFVARDAIYDLRRAKEIGRNKPDDMIKHVVDEGSTNEVYEHMLMRLLTVDNGAVPRKEKMGENDFVEPREKCVAQKKRKINESITDGRDGRGGGRKSERNKVLRVEKEPEVIENLVEKEKQCNIINTIGESGVASKEALVSLSNDHSHDEDNEENIEMIHCQGKLVAQARSVKINGEQAGGKLKGVVEEKHDVNGEILVKEEDEEIEGDCISRDCVASSEVEILDHDMVEEAGICSPFISSMKFVNCCMSGETSKSLGLPSAKDEFRKELLKVLRKPYDKEEHRKTRETIEAGSYTKHLRGLKRKLKKYRYNREKRLVLLRGILFWLQNVTREGAFEPWNDEQCLAVEIS